MPVAGKATDGRTIREVTGSVVTVGAMSPTRAAPILPPTAGETLVRRPDPGTPVPARVMVSPWLDPIVDARGVDPRSEYVELFWLGILGPSATWFLRRLAAGLERSPDGFALDLDLAARSLGLSPRPGRNSPFARVLGRCERFGMIRLRGELLDARRRVGPVPQRHLQRLPLEIQRAHERWRQADQEDKFQGTVQEGTVQEGTVQEGTVQEGTAEPGSLRSSSSVLTPNPVPPLVR
jgi:hypothetical protein